jgi:hypothetical protein
MDIEEWKSDEIPQLRPLAPELESRARDIEEMKTRLFSYDNGIKAMEHEDVELVILRFLLGHGSLEPAWTAFRKSLDWRIKNKSWEVIGPEGDEIQVEKFPHFERIIPHKAILPFSKTTKNGRPFLVDALGRVDVSELTSAVTLEEYMEYVRVAVLQNLRLFNKKSREKGFIVDSFLVIDLAHLSLGEQMKLTSYVQSEAAVYETVAPEIGGIVVVLNAPYFINMLGRLAQTIMNPSTCKKIRIFGSGEEGREFLRKFLDRDSIPLAWGGDCISPLDRWLFKHCPDFKEVNVAAGTAEKVSFRVEKPSTEVHWHVKVKSMDVNFSVKFVGKCGRETILKSSSKLTATESIVTGTFVASDEGHVHLHFDNSYSRWYSKQCSYVFHRLERFTETSVTQ